MKWREIIWMSEQWNDMTDEMTWNSMNVWNEMRWDEMNEWTEGMNEWVYEWMNDSMNERIEIELNWI